MKLRTSQPDNRVAKRFKLKFLVISLIGLALIISLATGGLKALADMVAAFFVTEPVKELTAARGDGITSTSEVNVADPDAVDGYYLKAKLPTDISADFDVYIWSDDSTLCTNASRCQLSTNEEMIYLNNTDSASVDNGDVITFKVYITSTNAAALAIPHDVDIEYAKVRINTMQTFSTAKCSSLPNYPDAGSELFLKDSRDDNVYRVRKLADDNCWMVDNLALQGPMTLDNTTSDMSDGSSAYSLPAVATTNGEPYCANLNEAIYPHKCGNIYAWSRAIAGATVNPGANASDSICPKNWRLPITGEYTALGTALSWGNTGLGINNSAWRGLFAGSASAGSVGSYGYYWTATYSTNYSNANFLNSTSSSFGETYGNTSNQQSVRCLAR